MPVHYARAQVLLVSLRRDPALAATLPGKVQACLAAGRPMLAAVEGAAAQVILEAGVGEVVPPEDPGALIAALVRLMGLSSEARATMGSRGRAFYAEQFSRAACMAKLEQVLESLAAPKA
jgi:glycosyltransferase involved in cell wall biosynthesis